MSHDAHSLASCSFVKPYELQSRFPAVSPGIPGTWFGCGPVLESVYCQSQAESQLA
jgi:hypothetical protein